MASTLRGRSLGHRFVRLDELRATYRKVAGWWCQSKHELVNGAATKDGPLQRIVGAMAGGRGYRRERQSHATTSPPLAVTGMCQARPGVEDSGGVGCMQLLNDRGRVNSSVAVRDPGAR